MTIVGRIKDLCFEKAMSIAALEKQLGFGNGSVYRWDKNSPTIEKVAKVADYFNVSIDYLLGKTQNRGYYSDPANTLHDPRLSKKDQKDIAQKLEELEHDLADYDATLMLSGEIMDEETRELLKASLANVVVIAKLKAKEKFDPHKNKAPKN